VPVEFPFYAYDNTIWNICGGMRPSRQRGAGGAAPYGPERDGRGLAEAGRRGGPNRRTAPPLVFYCFSGMCCVFFREAKPDLRHVQQDGLVCRAFGGACQLHAFLPEAPIVFCRSHTGMPHAPMQRSRADGVPSPVGASPIVSACWRIKGRRPACCPAGLGKVSAARTYPARVVRPSSSLPTVFANMLEQAP
jgi:hypothetical protein